MARLTIVRGLVAGVAAVLLVLGLAAPGPAATPAPLSADDLALTRAAFGDIDQQNWSAAEAKIAEASDPLPRKLVRWLDLEQATVPHTFAEYAEFIDQNPDWPLLAILRGRAEAAISGVPDLELLRWFDRHKPVSPAARLRYADLLFATGHQPDSIKLARDIWRDNVLEPGDEAGLRQHYGQYLSAEDDRVRLDNLLWAGHSDAALRMLPLVPPDDRALAEARLAFAASARNAPALLARVPKSLRGDPGLAFERARALRRKNADEDAAGIVLAESGTVRPELWWPERQTLARRLIQQNHAAIAYRLVAENHLTDPGQVVDAEFLAGWIALRFLKEPDKASGHFQRLYAIATLPVSLARGGYWAGRTAEALGRTAEAREWYDKAARHPTTFYGQLANAKPGVEAQEKPEPEPRAAPEQKTAFERKELVRAIRILLAVPAPDRLRPFLVRLTDLAGGPSDYALIADFAEEIGRPDLGVSIAKIAGAHGISLLRSGYPVVWMPRNAGTEQALLLALTRQESAFDPRAMSPSGARGLMQLMPGTAKDTARVAGVPFDVDRLLSDGEYNVTLGQAYFDGLLATFNGSYVMAIAAYNAGPGRVQEWAASFGDPRSPDVDPVDWIESIPFSETRNYVQRVLENLQVYRLRFGRRERAFSLEADLKR